MSVLALATDIIRCRLLQPEGRLRLCHVYTLMLCFDLNVQLPFRLLLKMSLVDVYDVCYI